MTWGAVAVGVGTVAGGYMSGEASKDAAEAGAAGADRASAISQAAADRARQDVNQLFGPAQEDLLAGYSGGFDLINQGIGEQQNLLQQGNMNAQQTVGGGFDQVRNALMGMPVDTQNFAPQGVEMSQLPQNPFEALKGQAPLFGSIQQNAIDRNRNAVSGMKTNRDVVNALNSGEMDADGIDVTWLNEMLNSTPTWGGQRNLMYMSNQTPETINQGWADSGLDNRNMETMRNLALNIQGIRGTSNPSAQQPNERPGMQRGRR